MAVARWAALARRVLITRRFDRDGEKRIGFASALTMLGASDWDRRSYLEITEALAARASRANTDLPQLFRRVVFSVLISNTDDHLRNHGWRPDELKGYLTERQWSCQAMLSENQMILYASAHPH